MVDPVTAALVASAIATAAKGAGDAYSNSKQNKSASRRAKEMKRETEAGLINEAYQRNAELESHRLKSRNRLGKSKSQSFQNTADLLRGASLFFPKEVPFSLLGKSLLFT